MDDLGPSGKDEAGGSSNEPWRGITEEHIKAAPEWMQPFLCEFAELGALLRCALLEGGLTYRQIGQLYGKHAPLDRRVGWYFRNPQPTDYETRLVDNVPTQFFPGTDERFDVEEWRRRLERGEIS